MFLRSKFCISPYGYGWGLRLVIAVHHACIPVIIQVGKSTLSCVYVYYVS